MLSKETLAKNMALLGEIYERPLSKPLMDSYHALLKEMNDDDFKQAVKRMLQERTFSTFPKPAEILSYSNVDKELVQIVDETELKAKEMIAKVEIMNTILFDEAKKTGEMFEDYVRKYHFDNVSDESKAILNSVKPYYDLKSLVINIRRYQTSIDAINAFKSAIRQTELNGGANALTNEKVKMMIGGRR
jgi:predicted restriction endonuclease